MVEKLFWQDPYASECDATVTRVVGNAVYVDKTIFFAFSGGQASDQGTFNNVPVKEAVKEENGEIRYEFENNSFNEGDAIHMKIDAERRTRVRSLHSAAHFVYLFVFKHIGEREVIGSNVTPEKARIDFEYAESLSSIVPELQQELDAVIAADQSIETFDDPENPGRRVWKCGDLIVPCGGTHAKSSGELGALRLKRKNIGAGKERIEIKFAG